VIVAVITVWMMEPAVDQIVDVIAMRDRLMAASGPMHMLGVVSRVSEFRRAAGRVLGAHLDDMFFDNVALLMVEMAVVEIVDVVAVLNGDMTASRAVLVRMIGVNAVAVGGHLVFLPSFQSLLCLASVLDDVVH
jgi:hypothetical protein